MTNKKTRNFILYLLSGLMISAAYRPGFSFKTHGNIANYFEDEKRFRAFFDFHKGDNVAEIGAGNGENMRGLSMIADSVDFYVQDIDAKVLNAKTIDRLTGYCKKRQQPLTNKFHRCIGTPSQTNLPANRFDKILLVSSFHEFEFMQEMLDDIHSKLRQNGRIYILEAHCIAPGHKNLVLAQAVDTMQKYGFVPVETYSDYSARNPGVYRAIFKKK